MARSYVPIPQADPILNARVEALKLLADHLSEPVVIFSPSLELVYSNSPAECFTRACPLLDRARYQGNSGGHPAPEPCAACPGEMVFEMDPTFGGFGEDSAFPRTEVTCPFPRAVPLTGDRGQVGCVLLMRVNRGESMVWQKPFVRSGCSEFAKSGVGNTGLGELIGQSPSMEQLREMIQLVAPSETAVLIQGESGTGKELVAKLIHRLSKRGNCPLVVVDCSALPESLLESELFGHVRGAFTGAVATRKGLFEEAEGGTIFLDDIADTSLTFQAKLLRVLQEGEVKPVGSSRSISVDVRVLSSSNKPLENLVKAKSFRADLYYRLAVLPIFLPPLRDRREDVPLLVQHFVKHSCLKHQKPLLNIHPEAMQVLVHTSWPGNVRELEHVIERIVVTSPGVQITKRDVIDPFSLPEESPDLCATGKAARDEAERACIIQALKEAGGKKTQAARLLRISRASLYNKLRAYSIE